MSRSTTQRSTQVFGPRTFLAFLLGVGIGLGLVGPVLPPAVGRLAAGVIDAGGIVVVGGVVALAVVMVLVAVLYQSLVA